VGNYAKLLRRENCRLATPQLIEFWRQALPLSGAFSEWFLSIETLKRNRARDYPADTLDKTGHFLRTFSSELEEIWRTCATRYVFVRHGRTACNDGTFLGQGRDPGILETPPPLSEKFGRVYSSPARRCQETAVALSLNSSPMVDSRLAEINYGLAEGMTPARLAAEHPEMPLAWSRGLDPCFPQGENTAAVLARLESFILDLPRMSCLVVTHNVLLRCLIGAGFGIPLQHWHHIPVRHLETISVLVYEGRWYLDLPAEQLAGIADAVAPVWR
jgi:broad specificity phosphatase PhoE